MTRRSRPSPSAGKPFKGLLGLSDGVSLYAEFDPHDTPDSPLPFDQPVVVFSNGMGLPLDHWLPVVNELDLPTVSFDRAGLGMSPQNRQPTSIDDEARHVVEVAKLLAPGHPLVLVGHSYGGLIVECVARLYGADPEVNLVGMVTVDGTDPTQYDSGDDEPDIATRSLMRFVDTAPKLAGLSAKFGEQALTWMSTVDSSGHRVSNDTRRRMRSPGHLRAALEENARFATHCRQALEIQQTHPLPPIPVDVIVARLSPRGVPFSNSGWVNRTRARWHKLDPNATIHVVPVRHLVMADRPDLIVDTIHHVVDSATGDNDS